MAYCNYMDFCGIEVVLCACDVIAEGLYRGSKWNWETGRVQPLNRYLCEQCAQNLEEMDDAKIRLVKKQNLPEEVWEEWNIWYEENAS